MAQIKQRSLGRYEASMSIQEALETIEILISQLTQQNNTESVKLLLVDDNAKAHD